ncbi:HD domain-containing phosphohydrolase [Deinococcus sp.]|nr:HD domain-containing phosphohydrolase [Deinococcus sp.]
MPAGYPTGLSGEDIPLTARIFTVCDAYDALLDVLSRGVGQPATSVIESL